MCGSQAAIDYSGSLEAYGWNWQTITCECLDENNRKCGMNLTIQADFTNIVNSTEIMIKCWNNLAGDS